MKVTLKNLWFAPGFSRQLDKVRSTGGKRYKAGYYDNMPDSLREHLPSNAIVHDDEHVEPLPDIEAPFDPSDVDLARAASDNLTKAQDEADARAEADEKAAAFQKQLADEASRDAKRGKRKGK